MKIVPEKRLFWFLKDGAEIDLADPAELDMYVQQVISRGRSADVSELLRVLGADKLRSSLERIKRFVPAEITMFWAEILENT